MSTRLAQIQDLIDRADHAYYTGGTGTLMEDAVYDGLKDELKVLAPDDVRLKRVGAPVPEAGMLAKRTHTIPMGSQQKAMNREEFMAWVEGLPDGRSTLLMADLKADGGSVSFEFVEGALYRAITRGDGFVGEDITANARKFKGVPASVMSPQGQPFSGTIRAEVVLTVTDWKVADPELTSNPRNMATGIARRKDGTQAELLSVVAFRGYGVGGAELAATESQMKAIIGTMGFSTPLSVHGGCEDVWAFVNKVSGERGVLPYWIDGVVAKIEDLDEQREQGETDNRPKGQVAIKFEAQGGATTLRSVELTVGHTGAIIPTAKFDALAIGGTKVSSALLCNWDEIRALDVAVGDEVFVTKQGEIIPKIVRVVARPSCRVVIEEPTACPVCAGPIGRKTNVDGEATAMIFCLNDECDAKVTGKIKRWLTSLNILGIGDEVLEALCTQLGVTDAADLYTLRQRESDLAAVTTGSVRLGEKRAAKIIEQIESTREISIEQFIGSLGVDGLGKRRVELIRQAVPGVMDTLEAWTSDTLVKHAEAAGVPKVAGKIAADLQRKRLLIEKLLANGVIVKASAVEAAPSDTAHSFCITGALSQPRGHYEQLIKAKGFAWKSDVSKGLTYLVMADPTSSSSKAEKARKLGTKTIGEDELNRLLS